MMRTATRLDDHIRECSARHGEMLRRIDDLSQQTRGEFQAVKEDRQRMHDENTAQFGKLYGGLWKAVAIIAGAILANYLAQHGFSPMGMGR